MPISSYDLDIIPEEEYIYDPRETQENINETNAADTRRTETIVITDFDIYHNAGPPHALYY